MSIRPHKDHWWLLAAPIIVTVLDASLTLAGQASSYWSTRSPINEVNPVGYWFLSVHPLFFAFGIALWIALYGAAILFLPKYVALVLATAVTLGHTWGASTWLPLWAGVVLWIVSLLVLAGIWIWGRNKIS